MAAQHLLYLHVLTGWQNMAFVRTLASPMCNTYMQLKHLIRFVRQVQHVLPGCHIEKGILPY